MSKIGNLQSPLIIDTFEKKLLAHNIFSKQCLDHFLLLIKNFENSLNETELYKLNKEYALKRAEIKAYSLTDILQEFSLFRESIMEHHVADNLIHKMIDISIQSTVLEFQRLHNEEILAEKRLRQRFIAALTHDLRTPLMASIISAGMIKRICSTDARVDKFVHKITHNLGRMENMIQDFLDLTLIRAGTPPPIKFSEFNLNALIEETIENLILIHGQRFLFKRSEDFNVYIGRRSIMRIVENLATNGIKYGSPSGMITISVTRIEEQFELIVHNEGNPIEIENTHHLFEDFKRTETAKSSDKIGWGVGLPLVKGLVDAHKGKITVTSNEESGTSFIIHMPIRVKDHP